MSNMIMGKNAIKEAIKNQRITKALLLKEHELLTDLKQSKIDYEIVDRSKLDKLTGNAKHQGIIAYTFEYKMSSLNEMLKKENGLIVVLDGIKDPHNLGAIIRTCDVAGVDGVIYKSHDSVKVNQTVAKVSVGAVEYVKYLEVTNITKTLQELKKQGYWIIGTDVNNATAYNKQDYKMNCVLVIGSEGKGISRLVKQECDFLVNIPNKGHVDSLNASVATGILLFNILNNRES